MGRLKLLGEQEGGGTDDHSALSNLAYAQSGHSGFVPSQGEALVDILRLNQNVIRDSEGNDRITLATVLPHLTLTGDARVTGNLGVAGGAPQATKAITIAPSPNPSGTSYIALGGQATLNYPPGGSGGQLWGLNFMAVIGGGGGGAAPYFVGGAYARCGAMSFTGSILGMYGLQVPVPFIMGGAPSIATWRALAVDACSKSQIVDAYGLSIGDITRNSGFTRLLELGPATPYLRLLGGGDPPANKSNLYLKFGSTFYRVVKSGSYMTLEAA